MWVKYVSVALMALHQFVWLVLQFRKLCMKDENGEDIDEKKGQRRLLSTDNPVVLPIDTNIEIIITAADVIHAWTVPAFGVKKDAVPGRLNQTWVRIDEPGTYFGQCSEICGINHAYMPVEIKAVTKEEFKEWLKKAKKEFAAVSQENDKNIQLASIKSN